jgi:hypothetical protein
MGKCQTESLRYSVWGCGSDSASLGKGAVVHFCEQVYEPFKSIKHRIFSAASSSDMCLGFPSWHFPLMYSKVSYSYKTNGKIIVLQILILFYKDDRNTKDL